MGFECELALDNQWNTYYPGQTINGHARITFDKPKKVRGISIKFKGEAQTSWTVHETRKNADGRSSRMSVPVSGSEEYFSISYSLVGSKSGGDTEIPAGTHTYPFTCALPPVLPSSFEGEHGYVRYTIKVTLDRPWKFDQDTKMAFTVVSHMDLNTMPQCRNPVQFILEKNFCCCWCKSGPLSLEISLPVSGYCSGQTMPFDINVENGSNVNVDSITFKLIKFVKYRSHTPRSESKHTEIVIAEIGTDGVPGNSSKNCQMILEIPPLPPSNLCNCGIIDLDYQIKMECSTSGCHFDIAESRTIMIGTVPLIGFNPPPPDGKTATSLPNVPNNDNTAQMPLLPTASENNMYPSQPGQPVLSSTIPYPVDNSGYPSQPPAYPNPTPYPTQPPAYPNQPSAPYPSENITPYPNQPGPPYSTQPSAPYLTQPTNDLSNASLYPALAQPVYREGQFCAKSLHDTGDTQHTTIVGNTNFAPRYPTYGFIYQ